MQGAAEGPQSLITELWGSSVLILVSAGYFNNEIISRDIIPTDIVFLVIHLPFYSSYANFKC